MEIAPPEAHIEVIDLASVPIFNQDYEKSPPPVIVNFSSCIRASDAILIVTPEYNYSIPGVLKNAIDWASRPNADKAFQGKPATIMSASTGMLGGSRAQYHLRQTFVILDIHLINKPEIINTLAEQKFDADGKLTDDKARDLIKQLLTNLVIWTLRLKAGQTSN